MPAPPRRPEDRFGLPWPIARRLQQALQAVADYPLGWREETPATRDMQRVARLALAEQARVWTGETAR